MEHITTMAPQDLPAQMKAHIRSACQAAAMLRSTVQDAGHCASPGTMNKSLSQSRHVPMPVTSQLKAVRNCSSHSRTKVQRSMTQTGMPLTLGARQACLLKTAAAVMRFTPYVPRSARVSEIAADVQNAKRRISGVFTVTECQAWQPLIRALTPHR